MQRSDAKAQKIVSSLYAEFTENYKLLPLEIRNKIDSIIKETFEKQNNNEDEIIARIVASYISTMSDTYAENMFCHLNASKDNDSL